MLLEVGERKCICFFVFFTKHLALLMGKRKVYYLLNTLKTYISAGTGK